MRYLSIDIETTGLDPERHQILEFCAVLEDTLDPISLKNLPAFHTFIIPENNELTGDVYALNMNAEIIDKIKCRNELQDEFTFTKIEDLTDSFLFWLSKNGFNIKMNGEEDKNFRTEPITVAGKNFNSFDKLFLSKVPNFNKCIRFRHRSLDPAILFIDWSKDDAPPSLETCKSRAGIHSPVSHRAQDDALDVIAVLRMTYSIW